MALPKHLTEPRVHPLPSPKFGDDERRAYDRLWDAYPGWLVSMLDRTVTDYNVEPPKKHPNLVAFAKSRGLM